MKNRVNGECAASAAVTVRRAMPVLCPDLDGGRRPLRRPVSL